MMAQEHGNLSPMGEMQIEFPDPSFSLASCCEHVSSVSAGRSISETHTCASTRTHTLQSRRMNTSWHAQVFSSIGLSSNNIVSYCLYGSELASHTRIRLCSPSL